VKEACKPVSFNNDEPKQTGYRVTEISWSVEQQDGRPHMLPGIKTELTLTHSDGEDFVEEPDRKHTDMVTARQSVGTCKPNTVARHTCHA